MKQRTRREFIKGTAVLAGATWGVQHQAARCLAAEGLPQVPPAADAASDGTSGSLLDLAPFRYAYRTDAPANQNPKETQ